MYQPTDFKLLRLPIAMPARDGETLFEKGSACTQPIEVYSGIARAVAYSRDGDRQILAFFFPGDVIGLPLSPQHRYSAEAVSGLSVIQHRWHASQIGQICDASPNGDLASAIWREEKAFIARSLILGHVGMRARMAAFLIYLNRYLSTVDGMLDFAIPQGDIASYLATSPETVCRALRRFRDEGLIEMPCRGRLQISDARWLDLIAEGE